MSDNTKKACSKCNGTGKVKVTCSTCHNTGEVKCSKCGGKGERECPHCDGTGHACPVCTRGYVKKDRWINCKSCSGTGYTRDFKCYDCGGRGQVKETYKAICPNCHGDYTNTDHVCDKCEGKKKISCAKHETCPDCGGKQYKKCPKCQGTGSVNKVSACDRRIFRALAMIGGLFGLHYVYIRRWGLFVLQFALLTSGVILLCGEEMFLGTLGVSQKAIEVPRSLLFFGMAINWLLSFSIKRDGNGGELREGEFKSGMYWLFAIFFGFTGAHLMYSRSFILLCISLFWFSAFFVGERQNVIAAIKAFPSLDSEICYRGFFVLITIVVVIMFLGWLRGLYSRKEKKS